LYVLVLNSIFGEPRPEVFGCIFFSQNDQQMETSFVPFGLLGVDFIEQFEVECIVERIAGTTEGQGCVSETDFLVNDVPEAQIDEYSVLPLCPFYKWVSVLVSGYNMLAVTVKFPN
jgi:hypothetical protein